LRYADGVKGYRLWDPTTHKLVINRDVIFIEDKMKMEENNSILKETHYQKFAKYQRIYRWNISVGILRSKLPTENFRL
jgi:hypothetical protein